MESFAETKKLLAKEALDGWLIWDFRRQNTLGLCFLNLPKETLFTRRFFYWIPKEGTPVKIVNAIEIETLKSLPGTVRPYRTWQELQAELAAVLKGKKNIAMEYSPNNSVPYVSKVDGGTLELVRSFGVTVKSSENLLAHETSRLSPSQIASHLEAARFLDQTATAALEHIRENLGTITEYDMQAWILNHFEEASFETEDPPIVAVNAHAANPHYSPSKEHPVVIKQGDFILLDMWCKKRGQGTIYADITRVLVAKEAPSEKEQLVFSIVHKAAEEAFRFVKERFERDEPVMGWEVDQKARDVIGRAGFGDFFIHRLGHNIGEKDHGDGAHLDNFETQDRRYLLKGTCFSIEPGIYLTGSFGVRLEFDVLVHLDGKVELTGGFQEKIPCLLSSDRGKWV